MRHNLRVNANTTLIAGAGPAGLSAAIVLAGAGRCVEVREARKTVGARFLGGFQMLDNFSEDRDIREFLTEYGIHSDFVRRAVDHAQLFDGRLHCFAVKSERPFGYFLTRGPGEESLDTSLLEQARAAGARVTFESRVENLAADIVATGPRTPDGIARELTFTTNLPDRVRVLFDARRAPGGYAYLFVLDGKATFGCALVRDLKNMDRHFEECLARFREIEDFSIENGKTGASYMTYAIPRRGSTPVRFAGEAGGFQDYLFGLGIRYAMTTGIAAARSILEGRPYESFWRPAISARHRGSLAARFLYEMGGAAALGFFVRRAAVTDFRRYLARWTRPSPGKSFFSAVARLAWKNRGRCGHEFPAHWCRSRDSH